MVVAARFERCARRRAKRRGVKAVEAQALAGKLIQRWRGNRAAKGFCCAKPQIVDQHDHDIRCALWSAHRETLWQSCALDVYLGDRWLGGQLDRQHGTVNCRLILRLRRLYGKDRNEARQNGHLAGVGTVAMEMLLGEVVKKTCDRNEKKILPFAGFHAIFSDYPKEGGSRAMRRSEIQEILTGRGWLAEIDPGLAAAVVKAGRPLALRKGERLYSPEDNPGGMFGVVQGGMLMATEGRDGLPLPGHIARRCHWFGYGSVLEKQRRSMIISANEPTVLLHVPLAELERLRTKFSAANRAYGKLATLGEALYLATVADLLIRDTDRRLAGVLLRVSGAEPPPYYPGYRPTQEELASWSNPEGVPLTQALLAELANASTHTVARFVDRANHAGLIDWRYGRVRILDTVALASFAAGELSRLGG